MTATALWPDLPGTMEIRVTDQHADFFVRNQVAVLVEHDVSPFGRYAGWLPLPANLLSDLSPAAFNSLVRAHLDHVFRPWLYADRPSFPPLDLFPRLTRLLARLRRLRERLS